MRVKKYLARTLPEAVAQVKADLGPEAIILHTQPVKIGGLFGFFAQRMIEVTAAAEPPALATRRPPAAPAPLPAEVAVAAQPVPVAVEPVPAVAPGRRDGELDQLRQEVERMSGLVGRMLERLDAPTAGEKGEKLTPAVRPVYQVLVDRGVEPELAAGLVRKIQARLRREAGADGLVMDVAHEVVSRQFGVPQTIQAGPGQRRVVALMGPTGVGKTTTLAKLAAFWSLRRHLKVALMTADTYRIAAVEQLRTYCEIIQVPLEVVENPAGVGAALQRHAAAELVLVDTAGRSHRNHQQMDELAAYLAALQPDERYLVLSLTASNRDALAVAEAYAAVGFDRILFTKLDEAVAPGITLNVLSRCQRPLSYVTTGQNVPDDIEVARPEKLSRVLLGDAI